MDKNTMVKRVNAFCIDVLLTISVPIAMFLSITQKTCEQGDWLTCSGAATYNSTYYLLLGYACTILALNFIILPIFFNNSIGKLIFGLKIVTQSDNGNPKITLRVARSAINLLLFPIYWLLSPFSLIEIILIRTGKIDRRLIDKLLGLQVVSHHNNVQ